MKKRKVGLRLVFFLLISFPALAQKSTGVLRASLVFHEAKGNSDSAIFYSSHLGYFYMQKQSYDSARLYYRKALSYNRYVNDQKLLADNLNNMGVLYYQTDLLDSGIHYLNAALTNYRQLHDTAHLSIISINLGIIYKAKGLYEKSLQYLLDAARILEKGEPTENQATCYNSIGNVYSKIGEPRAALEFHQRSLLVWRKLKVEGPLAASYNNIGNVYLLLKQYDSAFSNLSRALTIERKINPGAGESVALNNIGTVMLEMNKLTEAEKFFRQSLEIRLSVNDKTGEVSSRNNLARVFLLKGNINAAESELKKSEPLAVSIGLLPQLKEVYEIKVDLFKKNGDYNKALESSQQLLVVKDSLLNLEKTQSLTEMQTRYESVKKEDRIALLEKEGMLQDLELDSKLIWIRSLIGAIVLTLIIGILIYYNLRTVRKNKIHIEILLKELHHRVKNNLQILSSLLSLQSQQLTDDSAIKAVKSSESRINAMALIHRKLYTVDQNRTVDIKEYITELIQYLVYSYGYHERQFKLDLEIKQIDIDVDKAIPLGLILNELISNAFKHAYENHPNPRLMVNLDFPDLHELNIQIRDNGTGIDVKDAKKKTFGMKIVSTLIKELKGSLDIKSENGTTYVLHIPL
ncbi:MAG: tetratricopeptide repeat protein [Cyclobacteriaceae bacterium]